MTNKKDPKLDRHLKPFSERSPRSNVKNLREKYKKDCRRKYHSVKEFQAAVEEYFTECDKNERKYTIIGLARYLGFRSHEAISHYEGREEFFDVVNDARMRIEEQRNEQILDTTAKQVAGPIFDLKANFEWQDTNQVNVQSPDGSMSPQGTQITVLPPSPQSLQEWQDWYNKMLEEKRQQEIDVSPQEENDTT